MKKAAARPGLFLDILQKFFLEFFTTIRTYYGFVPERVPRKIKQERFAGFSEY